MISVVWVAGGLIAAYLSYESAVSRIPAWGELVMSAFDQNKWAGNAFPDVGDFTKPSSPKVWRSIVVADMPARHHPVDDVQRLYNALIYRGEMLGLFLSKGRTAI
jgi:hypothetical protein